VATKKKPKPEMSDEAVTNLARDLVTNRVYMSDQIRNPRDIPIVFMVVALMDKKQLKEWERRGIVHLYEYNSKASPRSINGMPCFTSCYQINSTDYESVHKEEYRMRKALGMEVSEQPAKESHEEVHREHSRKPSSNTCRCGRAFRTPQGLGLHMKKCPMRTSLHQTK
jgi:hypothetical protein